MSPATLHVKNAGSKNMPLKLQRWNGWEINVFF
jgi:hypothetical protein